MPSELRILRFRLNEVTQAVKNLAPHMELNVPEQAISETHAAPDGTPKVILRYEDPGAGAVMTNAQLAACLIASCEHALDMPLSRDATKAIEIARGNVDLRISHPDAVQAWTGLQGQKPETVLLQS